MTPRHLDDEWDDPAGRPCADVVLVHARRSHRRRLRAVQRVRAAGLRARRPRRGVLRDAAERRGARAAATMRDADGPEHHRGRRGVREG